MICSECGIEHEEKDVISEPDYVMCRECFVKGVSEGLKTRFLSRGLLRLTRQSNNAELFAAMAFDKWKKQEKNSSEQKD